MCCPYPRLAVDMMLPREEDGGDGASNHLPIFTTRVVTLGRLIITETHSSWPAGPAGLIWRGLDCLVILFNPSAIRLVVDCWTDSGIGFLSIYPVRPICYSVVGAAVLRGCGPVRCVALFHQPGLRSCDGELKGDVPVYSSASAELEDYSLPKMSSQARRMSSILVAPLHNDVNRQIAPAASHRTAGEKRPWNRDDSKGLEKL
jgi:hypothetical protein